MRNTQNIHQLSNTPDNSLLKTLDNPHNDRDYTISLNISELTCLCPIDRTPSFAKLSVAYIPDNICLEAKSFQKYIQSLRDSAFLQEEIINQIHDQLIGVLAPRYLHISASFQPINGVGMEVSVDYHQKDWLSCQLRLPGPAKLLDKPV